MRLCVHALERAPDAGELLARLASRPGLVALDSAAGRPRRWSLVAFDPVRGVAPPRSLSDLGALLAEIEIAPDDVPGPFRAGFLGALSYDLGVEGERPALPSDPWRSPPVLGGLYVDWIAIDHEARAAWLVLAEGSIDGRPPLAERRRAILDLLAAPARDEACRPLGPLVRHTPPALHRARIERLREWIAAGELYQANLAHRFTRAVEGHPVDLYRRLRAVNPAPYMAYVASEELDLAVLSASPELLLQLEPEGGRLVARTRPIKGTAARARDPLEDERRARALLASEKDRAELAMIVDLERNDLGRIARAGAVAVEGFPRLESYATVHHLVADVVAEPRPGIGAIDCLRALFPGGSISGAPKLAALGAIAELEGEGRGFFTGSAGFVDTRGHACWNVLIRTIVWRAAGSAESAPRAGEASFHVGGGITWSSDPAAEDRETLDKAAALAAALDPALATMLDGEPAPAR